MSSPLSPPPRETRSPKREATRARLIAAAAEAIGEKGFHAVSLDNIAARAGLTKGAIYDNFPSKEALFFAVVASQRSHIPFPGTEKSAPAIVRMRDFARAVIADGDQTRMAIPLRAEFLLYTLSRPEMRDGVAAWMEQGFAAEGLRLAEVFAEDELPMAPDRFVILLQAMIPGLMYLKTQAPGLVTDEAIVEIFEGLLRRK